MIYYGALTPHPPMMVPGIGKEEDRAVIGETIAAMETVARELADDPPETIIVFTPHGTVYSDAIIIYADPELTGDLRQFGLEQSWKWQNDLQLAERITERANQAGLPVYLLEQRNAAPRRPQTGLDHGVLVPLSFLQVNGAEQVRLIVIPLSYLPLEELYHFGAIIEETVTELGRKVAVIASGDLSHCLTQNAPATYDSRGAEFDQRFIQLLKDQAIMEFFQFDPLLLEKAAECGFRSLIMLLGTLDRQGFTVRVLSYQGPFGVGYGVAVFHPGAAKESLVPKLYDQRANAITKRRVAESPLVSYARLVVEAVTKHQTLPEPAELEEFVGQRAGTFVSIKQHGQLRGCIGTIEPTQRTLAEEIKQNAIAAATSDHRFEPIAEHELGDLVYSVDILKPAEPIEGVDQLDPFRYGVIVTSGIRRGLLLPNIEGVETVAEQVVIAKRKAGISPDDPVGLERFEVIRYH